MTPYEFVVDLVPTTRSYKTPVITCSQYDVGRPFLAHVYLMGSAYTIPIGSTVFIHEKKPDGHIISVQAVYEGGDVYFELEEQMSPVAGNCDMEISITGDDQDPIGSANFRMWVEPSVLEGGVDSESVIGEIQAAIESAAADTTAAIEQDMADTLQQIETSELNAQRSAEASAGSALDSSGYADESQRYRNEALEFRNQAAGYAGAATMGFLLDEDGDLRVFYNPDSEEV